MARELRGPALPLGGRHGPAELARDHELSGGSIINVLRYAALKAVARPAREVRNGDLVHGVRHELHKQGKFALNGG